MKYGFYRSARNLFNEPYDKIHMEIYTSYTECPYQELDCIDRAAYKRDFAVLKNNREIKYLTPIRYMSNNGRPLLYTFEKDLFYYPLVFCTIKNHPLLHRINSFILRMQENGLINKIDSDLIKKYQPIKEDIEKPLEIGHLEGIFSLYLLGIITGIFFFILEFIYENKSKFFNFLKRRLCN